jgi:hypothetical protein
MGKTAIARDQMPMRRRCQSRRNLRRALPPISGRYVQIDVPDADSEVKEGR